MKKICFIAVWIITAINLPAQENVRQQIADLLDSWHQAAASNDLEGYFEKIDDEGIYIGTDSSEIWTRQAFYDWSIPYFQQDKGWKFSAVQRNIYISEDKQLAWFDEQLQYGRGTLRGSGVVIKRGTDWRIIHYVLSVPVPNEKYSEVMKLIRHKPMIMDSKE